MEETARAVSLDGRRFTFEAPLAGLPVQPGSYVVVGSALGEIHDLELVRRDGVRGLAGEGVILAGEVATACELTLGVAGPAEVRAFLREARAPRAPLPFGELLLAPGVEFPLDAAGFDRHTFLCGQSGSGKTYALGGMLERLLVETRLRLVILDPNSDHVRLREVRAGVEPEVAAAYRAAAAGIAVRTYRAVGADRLRLRFGRLEARTQAALLRLDPVADREEYGVLLDLVEAVADGTPLRVDALDVTQPGGGELQARARNLGLGGWQIWAGDDAGSLDDEVASGEPRCLVVDLGSLPSQEEQSLTAASVLEVLWRERRERRPTLIVIDEAHNVCPQHPLDAVTAIATEHAVRIAAEGRKFGLHLLVATQRPQKVHENVVSQCDNLLLMRMNSTADLRHVGAVFSFVPQALVERAPSFRLGECVAAGRFAAHPALVRVGPRIAEEGGADVGGDWARPAG